MTDKDSPLDESQLENTVNDYVARSIRGGLSIVPYVGPIIAEFVTDILPNQRMDRIVDFLKQLNAKLAKLEATIDKAMLKDETKSRLMEESIQQAANSSSSERRAYLASLIAQGFSKSELEIQNETYFLNLLSQVNDAEILVLRYFLSPSHEKRKDFTNRHPDFFAHKTNAKNFDAEFYSEHLESMGLIYRYVYTEEVPTVHRESIYVAQYRDDKSQLPEGETFITSQGKELLAKISFDNEWLS